jgi:transposase
MKEMTTYEKYLNESWPPPGDDDMEMTDDMIEGLSGEDLLKLKAIVVRIGMGADQFTLAKRVVEKVYMGISVSNDKEKAVLTEILRFFLSPEKVKFKSILSKF